MAKKETKNLEFFTDWKYAPSPEATDHIRLQKQYDLFINGKFADFVSNFIFFLYYFVSLMNKKYKMTTLND